MVFCFLIGAGLACAVPGPSASPPEIVVEPTVPPTGMPPVALETSRPAPTPMGEADVIFTNANVLTMDPSNPSAQAVALLGDKILAVGSDEEVAGYQGSGTTVVDLGGKTLVPGFIDAHQHRIGNRGAVGIDDPGEVVQLAIEQGWTSIDELNENQDRLNALIEMGHNGVLRLRVDAYLGVNESSPEGRMLGDYYQAYGPGQEVAPQLRVAGLKIFTDFDNATILLWPQEALDAFVLARLQEGWPLAIKTVSTRSLEMILKAVESASATIPDIPARRIRLEHMLFATPDQIARLQQFGLVPVINLNNPGQLVGDSDVDQLIAREPQGSYAPWRSLEQAGLHIANATGWPSYYVDEPMGAPFGSPMHLIYQAVTRVGNLGTQPYPWLLDQTITAAQAMKILTIDGAFASFEEDSKGSLSPGKLADMVILSDNPVRVSAAQVNNIQVLMTMIGGKVEWCAPGYESLCPGATPAPAAQADPFVGDWSATDPADGSHMSLHVALQGGAYKVVLTDEQATACGLDSEGRPTVAAELDASGTLLGGVLRTAVTSLRCLSQPPTSRALDLSIDYEYQLDTDTLTDSLQSAIWRRP
jgi:predicted amidohydrolase YtcJ